MNFSNLFCRLDDWLSLLIWLFIVVPKLYKLDVIS